jgi:hypothetical protein
MPSLTPTQQALALDAFSHGMGPIDIANRLGLAYDDVYAFLNGQKLEALRRLFDPIPGSIGGSSGGGGGVSLTSSNGSISVLNGATSTDITVALPVLITQGTLQVSNQFVPNLATFTATKDSLYSVSMVITCYGDGLSTDKLRVNLTWTDLSVPTGNNLITFDMPGNVKQLQMETYPLSVKSGTAVVASIFYTANPIHYDANVRLVQMP